MLSINQKVIIPESLQLVSNLSAKLIGGEFSSEDYFSSYLIHHLSYYHLQNAIIKHVALWLNFNLENKYSNYQNK